MSDEKLKRAFEAAHQGERAPGFRAVLERTPSKRPSMAPLFLAGAIAVLVAVVWVARPEPVAPAQVPELVTVDELPLDFLLEPPTTLAAETPKFEAEWSLQ